MNNNENNNKSMWGKILQVVITILTAIATTFGVTSCMGY
ncbi:MAG: smalltalk protein [Bacteroides sp.]|nr:smalltalk protein [Bacteroides sp.]